MTLDEAILHCEEIVDSYKDTVPNCDCAKDHKQLAQWLKELKEYRKKYTDTIKKESENKMTWAELIREYYKLCIKSGCALDLSLDDLEPGAHYIFITAHQNNKYHKGIIGYVGLGTSGVEGRMISYDNYKDPDMVIESNIKYLVDSVKEN